MFLSIAGCSKSLRTEEQSKWSTLQLDMGTQIGSLAEVFLPESIAITGYGLAGGLRGTGSAVCPPEIRAYLTQYILGKSPKMDAEAFINSSETAVVLVQGMMPGTILKNQYFDLRVSVVPGTQTTSLQGGWLYGAELRAAGRLGRGIKVLAYAEGPVFFDTIELLPAYFTQFSLLRTPEKYEVSLSGKVPIFK